MSEFEDNPFGDINYGQTSAYTEEVGHNYDPYSTASNDDNDRDDESHNTAHLSSYHNNLNNNDQPDGNYDAQGYYYTSNAHPNDARGNNDETQGYTAAAYYQQFAQNNSLFANPAANSAAPAYQQAPFGGEQNVVSQDDEEKREGELQNDDSQESGLRRLSSTAVVQSPYSEIQVTEPERVGDHTSYKVMAKKHGSVMPKQTRRYQQFAWLFKELINKYPGVIVPGIPEKRFFGRFEPEFVESRRYFLEKFLQKVNAHPILHGSPDFKKFLEDPNLEETKDTNKLAGLFSSLTSGSISSSNAEDTWHETKKAELIKFESQLKKMQKRVEAVISQRKDLNYVTGNLWNDLSEAKDADIFADFSQLGAVQLKIEEVRQRESSRYAIDFGYAIEEYIRQIEAAKVAMNARARNCVAFFQASEKLQAKKKRWEKLMTQQDSGQQLTTLSKEIEQGQKDVDKAKKDFVESDTVFHNEYQRFLDNLKADFQESLQSYVKHMKEAHDDISKFWEDYAPQVLQNSSNE